VAFLALQRGFRESSLTLAALGRGNVFFNTSYRSNPMHTICHKSNLSDDQSSFPHIEQFNSQHDQAIGAGEQLSFNSFIQQ
jgi:hypothetical protein